MASPFTIHIGPSDTGLWRIQQTEAAAKCTSRLLQHDIDNYHVFFNDEGFHNHASHLILALYGTGAAEQTIERADAESNTYRIPVKRLREDVEDKLDDWWQAKRFLGKPVYYSNWLHFYQKKMEEMGWKAVLQKYLFNDNERGIDLSTRMYSSFVHPLIQLMYGIEWEQPALIAMGLAQASVHPDDLKPMLTAADTEANSEPDPSSPLPSILDLVEAIRNDEHLTNLAPPDLVDDISERLFPLAWDRILYYLAKVRVNPEEIGVKTAEMYSTVVYTAAAAAIRPPKEPRFDFVFVHHINASPMQVFINEKLWIPDTVKGRWLEWKIRLFLIEYIARGCPPLAKDYLDQYMATSSKPTSKGQPHFLISAKPKYLVKSVQLRFYDSDYDVEYRVRHAQTAKDDGHIIKLIRALRIGQMACRGYEQRPGIHIKGDEAWDRIEQLVIDSIGTGGDFSNKWVLNTGFEEAWKTIPDLGT